jgi:small subunit ribosomal protein S1
MVAKLTSDKEIPIPDEGWWASVLAEEESRLALQKAEPKDESPRKTPAVDWEHAMRIYRQDEIIALDVVAYNRGGLLVEGEGMSGFVPCSHLINLALQPDETRREDCFAAYVGRRLKLKIIECVPEEGRIVFSERAARAEAGKRPQILDSLRPGQRVRGEVTNVTDFGAFVDLGGVEGLIHISELSWGRVGHPSQVLQLGQTVEVMVMDVSAERCRIALSLKRLYENPWETVEARYPLNTIAPAVVTAIVPFGVFARLEEGLEGLVHTSEIPLPPSTTLEDFLAPGQAVQVRIIQVDASRQRLGLSMKFAP